MRFGAIKLQQGKLILYLTKLSAGDLKRLLKNRQVIVDKYDPMNPEGRKGYQRGVEDSRADEIAKWLSISNPILPPLLLGSLTLNCRRKENIRFDEQKEELVLSDDTVLHVVDGQHRIEGLTRSKEEDYEVPLTVVEGLNIAQEAGQFLVINTKQKKVRPDLQLRILYHQDRDNTRKLVKVLGVDNWKLEALALCIALNDRNESPWRNLILRPGEKKGGQWKPITEANFVDTLFFFSAPESPIKNLSQENKESFLIEYWNAIRRRYEDAFKEDLGRDYAICRGLGAGVFNTLAPALYNIQEARGDALNDFTGKIADRYPLKDWRRGRGKMTKSGTGHKVYSMFAEDILRTTDNLLDYIDFKEISRLEDRVAVKAWKNILKKAMTILSPIRLRSADDLPDQNWNLRACYSLLNLGTDDVSIYVGKSQNAKKRFKQHKDYNLYSVKGCGSDREMEDMEMALYHMTKKRMRENEKHPPPADLCPFCGQW